MNRAALLVALVAGLGALGAAQDVPPPAAALTEWGEPALDGTWLTANVQGRPFAQPDEGSDASLLSELVEAGAVDRVSRLELDQATERERMVLDEWKASHDMPRPLVVEPAGGRLPALTDEGRARATRLWRSTTTSMGPWAGPAEMGPVERCISRGPLGSMLPSMDYSAIDIVQAPGLVTIRSEAIHEARVIPIGDGPHLADSMRSYMGDARGYWDGETLVVETTNFNGRTGAHAGGNETPTSAAWTVAYELTTAPAYVWSEYACREGNYAMRNLLSISRAAEGTPIRQTPRPRR